MTNYMIDMAHYQNDATIKATGQNIDFAHVKANHPEIKCVAVKGTEGANFTDPYLRYNRQQAQPLFELFGIYMFPRAEAHKHGTISEQVAHYTGTVGELNENEFIFLDLEASYKTVNGIMSIVQPLISVQEALQCANELEQNYGLDVGMYFGRYFNGFFNNAELLLNHGRRPWLLPAYFDNNGQITETHESKVLSLAAPHGPAVWQFASQKRPVNGITGDVDWNKIYDLGHLHKITKKQDVIAPPIEVVHTILPKDTDMAKIIRVVEDGKVDNAVYSATGGLCCWISTMDEFNKLHDLGMVPDFGELQDVTRDDLGVFVLVSAAPSYADDYTGIKTTKADFRDQA